MEIKHYTLRISEGLLERLRYVAKYDGRSVNSQMQIAIRENIEAFEKQHGKIELGEK